MGPIRYGGTESGFLTLWYDEIFMCERFEEILDIEGVSSLGCVPPLYTYHRNSWGCDHYSVRCMKKARGSLHRRLVHCSRAERVAVPTGRHRKATRNQCTIRAPARDRELHAGSGSRKRSGVACGSGVRRTRFRTPPMRNPMRDLARDPWFHGRLNARSVISYGIRSSM